jgi:hypothetical protein
MQYNIFSLNKTKCFTSKDFGNTNQKKVILIMRTSNNVLLINEKSQEECI